MKTPTLATGNKAVSQGFTLIELLVVVLIIGLVTGLVAFTIGDSAGRSLETQMKTLANRLSLVSQDAGYTGVQWGLDLYQTETSEGERYVAYDWLVWNPQAALWQHAESEDAQAGEFVADAELTLIREQQQVDLDFRQAGQNSDLEEPLPDLVLYSSGDMTRFSLDARLQDESLDWLHIQSGLLGQIQFSNDAKTDS